MYAVVYFSVSLQNDPFRSMYDVRLLRKCVQDHCRERRRCDMIPPPPVQQLSNACIVYVGRNREAGGHRGDGPLRQQSWRSPNPLSGHLPLLVVII